MPFFPSLFPLECAVMNSTNPSLQYNVSKHNKGQIGKTEKEKQEGKMAGSIEDFHFFLYSNWKQNTFSPWFRFLAVQVVFEHSAVHFIREAFYQFGPEITWLELQFPL